MFRGAAEQAISPGYLSPGAMHVLPLSDVHHEETPTYRIIAYTADYEFV